MTRNLKYLFQFLQFPSVEEFVDFFGNFLSDPTELFRFLPRSDAIRQRGDHTGRSTIRIRFVNVVVSVFFVIWKFYKRISLKSPSDNSCSRRVFARASKKRIQNRTYLLESQIFFGLCCSLRLEPFCDTFWEFCSFFMGFYIEFGG